MDVLQAAGKDAHSGAFTFIPAYGPPPITPIRASSPSRVRPSPLISILQGRILRPLSRRIIRPASHWERLVIYRLRAQAREAVSTFQYSIRTEEAYIRRVRRYILSCGKRHPAELGAGVVYAFVSHLPVGRKVLRLTERLRLRVEDVDLARLQLTVRDGNWARTA